MSGDESSEETVRIAITRQSGCESRKELADLLQNKIANATIRGSFRHNSYDFPSVLKAQKAGFKSPNYANVNYTCLFP